MRLVFFGSGDFGIPTLQTLVARGHSLLAVVTQPDRPAGRGAKCRSTPVHLLAESLGAPVLDPEKPDEAEFVGEIARLAPDLAVVVAYGHLLRRQLLDIPRLGFVNLHASLLPAYRGAAPVPRAILNGESESGASVFLLNDRFDRGGILGQVRLPIGPDDTAGSYLASLAPLGAQLMADTVAALAEGRVEAREQDGAFASSAPKLRKNDGLVDWNLPYEAIERRVRAFQPWPLAHTALPTGKGDVRVNILEMAPSESGEGCPPPGAIIAADPCQGLLIQAGDRPVRLCRLQPEGKRAMTDTEFLRGTRVK